MKAIAAKFTRGFPHRAKIPTCDNSGAKMLRLISLKGGKTVKRRMPSAQVGDLIQASVIKGNPEMRKTVVTAVIVRQKKSYRRPDGTRVAFESNAAVVLKDDRGNPKGTIFKGPISKEAAARWKGISKVAKIIA
tara:strand:+ start:1062 stop:1463 length:402 start_codon:yes stop_codon:yes gene_type:complete